MQTYSGNEPVVEQSVYEIIVKNLIVVKLFSVAKCKIVVEINQKTNTRV